MMRFRLLGPLEVWDGEDWREIRAAKWRSLLAVLLIKAGQVVPVDVLISEMWQDAAPETAANLVSIYVLRLRRLMGDKDSSLLRTRAPGYQLRPGEADSDVQVFEALVQDGRRALAGGDAEGAAGLLAQALALWRGSPLADVPPTPLVEAETERLAELRLDARELRITAELACGGHAQVIPELRRLLADHPLREGLWALLMRALDGAGRHAEALDAYGQARNAIAGELGVDPGAELRHLYTDMLAQDDLLAKEGGEAPGSISAGTVTAGAPESVPSVVETRVSRPVPAPAQLPADVTDFTGREDQVRHLCDLLSGAGAHGESGAVRIALVAGSGGLGKTSLAVHAAHRVRGSFPDGQLYVDLLGATAHPLGVGDVLARFLRDLGVDGRDIPVDEAERAARFRTILAGRRMLIVLDNARDAAQVRPLLPGTASCSVLVTTRSRMPDLASTQLVDLNVLDDEDALTLFSRVVGNERAAAEPEATAEVLLACAGLPLAIRICAARLATRSGWTIAAMANRLRDEQRRLDELSVGDLAVRASFQVSFAALSASAQPDGIAPADAFRLLGLWPGPSVSAAAAAALFGTREYLAAAALEALVDARLLESTSTDRYKFHDLLRVYSSERAMADLSESARGAAIGRLLRWYMRTSDAAATAVAPHRYNVPLEPAKRGDADPAPLTFTTADEALSWYDSERVNVVAATRQASSSGLHDVAWRLPAPLFVVFQSRNNWVDCISTHRIALDSARRLGNRQGEAWVLNNLGYALGITGDSDSIGCLEQALSIRREIGDRIGEAQAANNLADAYRALGKREEALELLLRALDLNREVGYRLGEGVDLVNLGDVLLGLDRAGEAIGYLEQALLAFAEIGHADGTGYARYWLGRCHASLGRDPEALDCLRQALASHQAAGSRYRQAVTLRDLGRAQARTGLVAEAKESWAQAAGIFDDLGDSAQAAEIRGQNI